MFNANNGPGLKDMLREGERRPDAGTSVVSGVEHTMQDRKEGPHAAQNRLRHPQCEQDVFCMPWFLRKKQTRAILDSEKGRYGSFCEPA